MLRLLEKALRERLALAERDKETAVELAETKGAAKPRPMQPKGHRDDKDREETVDRLKDMKAKLSTKMVRETLDQHCDIGIQQVPRSTEQR